jgi:signal transduction histidine kinase
MTADSFSQIFATNQNGALLEKVQSHRGELISLFQRALRKYLFTNRSEVHPRSLADIAVKEADALILFLGNPGSSGKDHGAAICQIGLSSQTVFGLIRAQSEFFYLIIGNEPDVMNILSTYQASMLNGFFEEREKIITDQQESFRLAFQMALNRSKIEKDEARSDAQKATESNYRNIILAQEEERRRISRELHDEAGQALIGIHMSLENILNDSPTMDQEKRQRIEKTVELTDDALKEIRALAYSLRPPVLDLLGIHLTIKQLCLDFSEKSKLNIIYAGIELPVLADELAITIYRVVQEALTNIAKHAHAKHVSVKLGFSSEGIIQLTVRDDGKGFDPRAQTKGIGLTGIRERLRLLNGSLDIDSVKGKFSQLTVFLPLVSKTPGEESAK